MYKFALGTAVALVALGMSAAAGDPKGMDAKRIDGAWTVSAYEKDGQAQAEATGMAVKADAGTITCSGKDGKAALTMKVEFGPNGTVRVTEVSSDSAVPASPAKAGVYVLTADYLAICIHETAPAGGDGKASDAAPAKSRCSLFLKRDGAK
jgi:uncharacterized protein (TIGR03067 family)